MYEWSVAWDHWLKQTQDEREREAVSYIRKRDEMLAQGVEGAIPLDDAFQQKHPAAFEYLTSLIGPDGRSRRTSTFTLSAEDGQWKGCLNDRETGFQLFVTAGSVTDLFERLEAVLTSPEPHWRRNPWVDKQRGDNKGRK